MEGAVTPATLLRAYAAGVFPMAEGRDDPRVHWVDPRRRGVLPMEGPRISRSLARRIRRGGFEVAADRDFAGVLDACAARDETWINAPIRDLYLELHRMGHAHSVEVRRGDALIGGIYGVALGAAFFGESMVSGAADGSKLALVFLMQRLRAGGFTLFDTQFLTPHLASLGAVEIPRADYRRRLAAALERAATFDPPGWVPDYSVAPSPAGGTGAASAGSTQRSGQTS